MSLFVVDVESDGPSPAQYNMVCFGSILVDTDLQTTFYGKTKPHPNKLYNREVLAISGFTREEHLWFPEANEVMLSFKDWVLEKNKKGRPVFVSDNPAFDWQWISYYFDFYNIENPFGHSARRIGDFWAGLKKDFGDQSSWKEFRKTIHSHNPIDDAKGNAEALHEIAKLFPHSGLGSKINV